MSMIELEELTRDEKGKPYAKYYRPAAAPSLEHAKLLADPAPINPAMALPIEKMNDLLDPGYHEVETGYCAMPDGSGYVAALMPMSGVTVEMVRWWMAWFTLEDLRYKIWFPRDHFGVSIRDEDRALLTDPAIPWERKIQNPSPWHCARENVGTGIASVLIDMMSPEDQGFDMSRFHAPNVATTVGGVAVVEAEGTPSVPVSMVHFIRDTPGGIEYRSRFWMGYGIVDRKPALMLPPGARIPEEAARGLLEHCIGEYSNLAALLPKIYGEFGNAIP